MFDLEYIFLKFCGFVFLLNLFIDFVDVGK